LSSRQQAEKSAKNKKTQKPTDFWETKKGQQLLKEGKKDDKKETPSKEKKPAKSSKSNNKNQQRESEESSEDESEASDEQTHNNTADASNAGAPSEDTDARTEGTTDSKADIAKRKLEALKARASGKGQKGTKKPESAAPTKKGKKMTTWDDKPAKGAALKELDHSKDSDVEVPRSRPAFDPSVKVDVDNWGESDEELDVSEESSEDEKPSEGKKKKPEGTKKASSGLMSFFKTFTNRQLSQEDLE